MSSQLPLKNDGGGVGGDRATPPNVPHCCCCASGSMGPFITRPLYPAPCAHPYPRPPTLAPQSQPLWQGWGQSPASSPAPASGPTPFPPTSSPHSVGSGPVSLPTSKVLLGDGAAMIAGNEGPEWGAG